VSQPPESSPPPPRSQGAPRTEFFSATGPDRPPDDLPPPPGWRDNSLQAREEQGKNFQLAPGARAVALVNAALLLRRPLLVTGRPGTGKSTLARAVAERLDMGPMLEWSITTRTTLQDGLYQYDAIARLNAASILRQEMEIRGREGKGKMTDAELEEALKIGRFIRLGPLGTALACPIPVKRPGGLEAKRPRVLLIDEIDKGDIDLPNDLLHVFEKGEFEIKELSRLVDATAKKSDRVTVGAIDPRTVDIVDGWVHCEAFPLVVMTSNGEREFPPAFLRRCLRLKMEPPNSDALKRIVKARISYEANREGDVAALIERFLSLRDGSRENPQPRELAVDQLLNAVYLLLANLDIEPIRDDHLFQSLTGSS
jgi:MoxR-like ATPase